MAIDKKFLRDFYEDKGHARRTQHDLMQSNVDKIRKAMVDKLLQSYARGSLLDVGCAEGMYLFDNCQDFSALVGADIAQSNLERAYRFKKTNDIDNVGFVRCDIEALPFKEGSFNTVLCLEVLEHLLNPEAALKELERVAKEYVVISVPTKGSLWRRITMKLGIVKVHKEEYEFIGFGGGHLRDYNVGSIVTQVESAGLQVQKVYGVNVVVYPLQSIVVRPVLKRLGLLNQYMRLEQKLDLKLSEVSLFKNWGRCIGLLAKKRSKVEHFGTQ